MDAILGTVSWSRSWTLILLARSANPAAFDQLPVSSASANTPPGLVGPARRGGDATIWIHTELGFFSITAFDPRIGGQREDAADLLVIRARVREDLERIEEWIGSEILATPEADYPHRVVTSREAWNAYLAHATAQVDYTNFKARIASRLGWFRHDVLLMVWSNLRRLQDEARG